MLLLAIPSAAPSELAKLASGNGDLSSLMNRAGTFSDTEKKLDCESASASETSSSVCSSRNHCCTRSSNSPSKSPAVNLYGGRVLEEKAVR